jgi:hypothetical protein
MKRLCRFTSVCFGLSLLVIPSVLQAHDVIICKQSDTTNPVTGSFSFTVNTLTQPVSVMVGGPCVDVGPQGTGTSIIVTELPVTDTTITDIQISGTTGKVDTTAGTASFDMPSSDGDVTVTFTNATVQIPGAKGRWTGGGSIDSDPIINRITHGFELHCSIQALPNNLEINWGPPQATNKFHLDALTSVTCGTMPVTCSNGVSVPFISATGLGDLNGTISTTITFFFSDAGSPGKNDFASYMIGPGGSILTASGCLDSGNQDFHAPH